ncbi:MAG TPA: molybdopterin dinucleotide binding domain-containing protein, partial [Ktedonobacteraceae bacterium]|nr:molybdopterin dinucleotide binding domain-containing protein [Ktedonobacteraceae bacterium]
YGCFEIPADKAPVFSLNERALQAAELEGSQVDEESGTISRAGVKIGVMVDERALEGFATPSRKLEFYSATLKEWGWPEYATPGYIHSHVHSSNINAEQGEYLLIPTFRLPTLIHTRSGNAKWLNEISNANPVWIHPRDAERIGVASGDLVRITTEIGYYVNRAWVTEGIRPGVVACSHHLGRWRLDTSVGTDRWTSALVALGREQGDVWRMRQLQGIRPYESADPDSVRIFWREAGVHQNLTFGVHPDPISGMHCWHQKVTVEVAHTEDHYGDVFVDRHKAQEVYAHWLAMTRPQTERPDNLRRPLWMIRPYRPAASAFKR